MTIQLNLDADITGAMNKLNGMSTRAANFSPLFHFAKLEIQKSNIENFTTHGLPVGGWAPRRSDYGWPIMRKSGELFSSLANLRGPANDIGRKSAIFGTNVEYAKFHQRGTRHMPKRAVVFEPPIFAQRLGLASAEYVADGLVPN